MGYPAPAGCLAPARAHPRNEAPQRRGVPPRPIVHQPRAAVQRLAGEGALGEATSLPTLSVWELIPSYDSPAIQSMPCHTSALISLSGKNAGRA